eukprot:gene10791-11991_t
MGASVSILFCILLVLISNSVWTDGLIFQPRAKTSPSRMTMSSEIDFNQPVLSPSESSRASIVRHTSSLLKALACFGLTTQIAHAKGSKGPEYLVDPTEEFKEEEAKMRAFSAAQRERREAWDRLVGKFSATEDPSELAGQLKAMKLFLQQTRDLPVGFRKHDFVKVCRSKKFLKGRKTKPFWTTEVEIEYQSLIAEINRRLVPVDLDR